MKSPILVKRYPKGWEGALKNESDFVAVSRELTEFQGLLSSHGVLKGTLASPFVAARKKAQVIRDVLARSGFTGKTCRFILLLLDHNRLGLLGGVLEAVPGVCVEAGW